MPVTESQSWGGGLTPAQFEALQAGGGGGGGGLTNAELRATPVPVAPNITRNSGNADANTQRVTLAADGPAVVSLAAIDADLGAIGTSPPTLPGSSTGVQGLLRWLGGLVALLPLETGGNLAALLARTPVLGAAAAAGASPVAIAVEAATGNITTQNLVPNGAATANSAVEIALLGNSLVSIQVTGTYTGALSIQLTNNGSRWETVTAAQIVNAVTGAGAATIASTTIGIFTFNAAGFLRARVTGLAAMTGTAAVTLRSAQAPASATVVQPTGANLNATVAQATAANLNATVAQATAANLNATAALAAGTNLAGDVGLQVRANATGAATVLPCQSPATPAVGTLKASAGRLLGYTLTNTAAALRYVKLFNVTAPTLGTTAALIEIGIPAGATIDMTLPVGMAFSTAIVHTVTSDKGLTDNTATGLAAADVVGWFAFA